MIPAISKHKNIKSKNFINLNNEKQIAFEGNFSNLGNKIIEKRSVNFIGKLGEEALDTIRQLFIKITRKDKMPFTQKPLIVPESLNELKNKILNGEYKPSFHETLNDLRKLNITIDANDKLMFHASGSLDSLGADKLAGQIMSALEHKSINAKEALSQLKTIYNNTHTWPSGPIRLPGYIKKVENVIKNKADISFGNLTDAASAKADILSGTSDSVDAVTTGLDAIATKTDIASTVADGVDATTTAIEHKSTAVDILHGIARILDKLL